MVVCAFEFNVILGNNEKICTFKCNIDVFSINQSEISKYVSDLNGTVINSNTVRVFSDESFTEMVKKLSSLTLSKRLSKKR